MVGPGRNHMMFMIGNVVYRCLSFFSACCPGSQTNGFLWLWMCPLATSFQGISDVPYVKPKRTQKLCMDDMAYFGINFAQISSKLQPGLSASPFVSMQLGHHDWHYVHRIGKLLGSFVCFCVLLHSMALLELMIGEGSGVIRNECLVTVLFWRLPWSQAIFLGLSMDYSDGSLPWTLCDLVPCQSHQLKLSVRNWWYAWCMLILWGVFLHFCHRDLLQGAVILQGSIICLPTCSLGFVYRGFL